MPHFIVITPDQQNAITLVEGYILIILLVAVILLFTINMLHSERIAVLKKTIQIKDVRINELELSLVLKCNAIDTLKEENVSLKKKLEKYQKAFLVLSSGLGDCMKVTNDSLRKFLLSQSPQAEKLEKKIWKTIEQEQKVEAGNKV